MGQNGRAPFAVDPATSRGRYVAEPPSLTRTPYQRDRDRIVHSTAFRRLKHKTQVFVAYEGDHFRTRLTHTIEVSQIARAFARAFRLDEDLTEAVALVHDFGHTPFGHAGERVLAAKMAAFEEERAQLRQQAKDFRHQAAMYDRNKLRCSYLDCLRGKASVPKERAGMLLFQALMIGGMVTIMTSFNGYRHSGLDFFINYHWMYPLTFCITFLIREWFMNDFTEAIIHQFILPNFQGVKKATLITLTNIVCMVPLMSTLMTCMIYGFDNLGQSLLEQVPITMVVGACVNFFIVSPIVKMIYNNLIVANTQGETGTYSRFQELIMPILSAFNS
jgi:hypothetical protein